MLRLKRFQVMKLHVLLAAVMLPIALLYFISGALYTLDIKGTIAKQNIDVELHKPFEPNLMVLANRAKQTLLEHPVASASG